MADTTDRVITADELAALPDDGKRYELRQGVLLMMSPAGGRHGGIAATLLVRITNYAEQHGLGKTFAAETGFLLRQKPDTVLAPDVAFVSYDRLGQFAKHPGYLPLAPDLVAEVVSPNDRSSEVEDKARIWLDAGVQVVLVVDPQNATIRVYRTGNQIQVYARGSIELPDVLPGYHLDVIELFA